MPEQRRVVQSESLLLFGGIHPRMLSQAIHGHELGGELGFDVSPGGAKEAILAAILRRNPCAAAHKKCYCGVTFGRDFFRPWRGWGGVGG